MDRTRHGSGRRARAPHGASATRGRMRHSVTNCFDTVFPPLAAPICGGSITILDQAIGMGCPLTLVDRGPGDGVGSAPGVADSAARDRMDRVSEHHRRGLLSRRAPLRSTDARRPIHEVPDLRRRRGAARREDHPRHRHGLRRGRAAGSGPVSDRRAAASGIPEEDDGHGAALPAGRALRGAGAAQPASSRDCWRPATAWPFRSLSARPATAACFSIR